MACLPSSHSIETPVSRLWLFATGELMRFDAIPRLHSRMDGVREPFGEGSYGAAPTLTCELMPGRTVVRKEKPGRQVNEPPRFTKEADAATPNSTMQ
jgi:hypothetical protein